MPRSTACALSGLPRLRYNPQAEEGFGDDRVAMMTKRQLGKLCAGIGLLAALVILALDVLFPGREGGFGPGQITALLVSIALFLLGMSLLPLGDDPA